MAPAADVALALCAEARGENEEALEILDGFLAKHPDNFMTPIAVFAQARVLGSLGRLDEERAIYEDFIASNPDSLWITQAETALLSVKQRLRAANEG